MPPTDRFVAEARFYVRYAETDAMGIIHHASYVIYMEEARLNFVRERGANYAKMEEQGYYLAVSEIHTRYLAPARYGIMLAARCWIDELKSRSVTFGYEIADSASNQIHMTGQSRHICITHEGQVARLPESWLEILK